MIKKENATIFTNLVINRVLIISAIMTLLIIAGVFVRDNQNQFTFSHFAQFGLGTLVIALAIFRNKINPFYKIWAYVIILILTLMSGLMLNGFLTSAKAYFIVIPVFLSFILPLKKAIVILFVLLIIYGTFGLLYAANILVYSYNLDNYALSFKTWATDGIIIVSSVTVLLITAYSFKNEVDKNYNHIILQNEKIQNNNIKYQTLYENAYDAILLLKNDTFIDCNQKAGEYFGSTKEEIIGKNVLYFSPDLQYDGSPSQVKALEYINSALQGNPQQFEWLHKKQNGELIDVSISLIALVLNNETIIHAVLRDITWQKKIFTELKSSQEKYEKLVLSFPDIIMVSDLQGNIVFTNEHFEKITGIPKSDYTNRNRKARIHPDDMNYVLTELTALLQGNMVQTPIMENRFIDHSGNVHWFSGTMSKVFINNQMFIQTISRDITEKKQTDLELENYRNNLEHLIRDKTADLKIANEELRSINEELYTKSDIINEQNIKLIETLDHLKNTQTQLLQVEKMASLGVLTAGVAHEINNPLNYIMGAYLGLESYFEDYPSKNPESTQFLLNCIKEGVTRTSDIINSLNQFSVGTSNLNENCDIHAILDNCLVMLNHQIKHSITVNKNYSDGLSAASGNAGKLHQAFINILTNAIQAIDNNGIINISTYNSINSVLIEIKDNGHGINKENLSKITDPFFTTKEPGKGTGLGLSISYSIIKEHQGTIAFQSEENTGTTVYITIPSKKTD